MEDLIRKFAAQLKEVLQKPLPAEMAQRLMAPAHDVEKRFAKGTRELAQKGAVLILFYPEHDEIVFPLIRRAEYPGVHSGQIGLPGGKMEPVDHSVEATALRETLEEIGIDAANGHHLGNLTPLFIPVSNFLVHPVVYYIDDRLPAFNPDPTEVSEVLVARLDQLTDPRFQKRKMMTIRDFTFEVPYFELNQQVVWGATAMILSELVEIIKTIRS